MVPLKMLCHTSPQSSRSPLLLHNAESVTILSAPCSYIRQYSNPQHQTWHHTKKQQLLLLKVLKILYPIWKSSSASTKAAERRPFSTSARTPAWPSPYWPGTKGPQTTRPKNSFSGSISDSDIGNLNMNLLVQQSHLQWCNHYSYLRTFSQWGDFLVSFKFSFKFWPCLLVVPSFSLLWSGVAPQILRYSLQQK